MRLKITPTEYEKFVLDTNDNLGPIEALSEDCVIHGAVSELVAEAGEVMEVIQKANRKANGILSDEDYSALYDEAGDVLWGLQSLLNVLPGSSSLIDLMEYNKEKLTPAPPPLEPPPTVPTVPPVVPPGIVDPTPPPSIPPPSIPPPSGERPGETLDWGLKLGPDRIDVHVAGDHATYKGVRYRLDSSYGLGDLYRLCRFDGIYHPVFGFHGPCFREFNVGGKYNLAGRGDLSFPGDVYVNVTAIGLTVDASVPAVWSFPGSRPQSVGVVRFFDIGIRGSSDSFVVRASSASKEVYLEGCWWLPPLDSPHHVYTSGLHIHQTDTLVIKDHVWRGETPELPGMKFREHPLCYIKSIMGSILLDGNNLYGGNRTGFQVRPDVEHNPLPTARIMCRDNFSVNYGDNWDPGNPATSDGGAAMTFWVSTNGLYIYDNYVENFRYKALSVGGQPSYRNFNFQASGNQHSGVYVSGNEFIPGPITERSTAGFSACDYVKLFNDNKMGGRVVLNTRTNDRYNGLRNLTEQLQGPWDKELYTYDKRMGVERPMTEAEITARLVR